MATHITGRGKLNWGSLGLVGKLIVYTASNHQTSGALWPAIMHYTVRQSLCAISQGKYLNISTLTVCAIHTRLEVACTI